MGESRYGGESFLLANGRIAAMSSSPSPEHPPSFEKTFTFAKRALALMAQYHIDPSPANYALWYHYVAADTPELTRELDRIVHQGLKFTPEVSEYLTHKFIDEVRSEHDDVRNSAEDARELLAEILEVIQTFRGDTASYNQELDQHVSHLTGQAGQLSHEAVGSIVKEIIASAAALRVSGAQLNDRLNASQQEIEQLRQNLAQVTNEAERDFLTGVANRKALDKALEEQITVAQGEHKDLSILMLDIDHFKHYNDHYGHLIGDEVLKIVAKSLTDSVKGKDVVGRYGGEEFCVVLPNTPVGAAMIVAENIRQTIASRELKRKDTGEHYGTITVSIGVAFFHHGEDSLISLVQRADEAMYRSKKAGRNRVTQETIVSEKTKSAG